MKKNRIQKAVALRYDPEESPAPVVIAKGMGKVAERIILKGEEYRIPIENDETLTELLYPLEIGKAIPESLYRPVAQLLAYIFLFRQQRIVDQRLQGGSDVYNKSGK